MVPLARRLRDMFSQPSSVYAKPVVRRIILGMAFFFLFMIILSADFIPDKVSLQVGQVSDRDVVASRTVSYVNADKTKKLEDEVLAGVANVYDLDNSVLAKSDESIANTFSAVRKVQADSGLDSIDKKVERFRQTTPVNIGNDIAKKLIESDETRLVVAEEQIRTLLRKYFGRGIREEDLEITKKHIELEAKENLNDDIAHIVAAITQQLLKPNYILNVRETEKRKQAALSSIEPVRDTVKKGQIIVRRGDVVTKEQIHAMEELGMYKGQVNELRMFGLTIYVLTVMAIVLGYLYKFARPVYDNDLHLVLLGLIIVLTLMLAKVAHYYSDFAAPIAAGALLTAILIDVRVGLLISVALAMMFGIIVDNDLRAVASALIGSMIGVYSVYKMAHGYSLIRTGLWIAAVNFLVIGSTGFIDQTNDGTQILMQGLLGVVSGIGSTVITTGLLPYLEHTFNITTPIKLLELAQPNHPLLQRLLVEAPGTYHHSILVGNLAEAAADSIGADVVIARVGAYYHDIGKIKRPYFFIENQIESENPHDKIAPSLSTLIVTSHIKDGLDLCRDYNIPGVITDIVREHHGTMLVSYFYKRATETEHSECIIEADFRYEGPKPQTREAAIIMLADACEAAVRSISKPNINRIEAMVRKIVRERLHDGQFDECDLTLKDLDIISEVFIRILSSMFHSRIEYPESIRDLERKRAKNGNGIKQLAAKDENNAGNGTNNIECAKRDGKEV